MKKIGLLLLTCSLLLSCGPQHPKEYLTFSGTIKNTQDTVLTIVGFNMKKEITIAPDGSFKDTLKLNKKGNYRMSINDQKVAYVFLNNGYDLYLEGDANAFDYTMPFRGDDEGAQTNNFLGAHFNYTKSIGNPGELFGLEKDTFFTTLDKIKVDIDSINSMFTKVDVDVLKETKGFNEQFQTNMRQVYDVQHERYLTYKKLNDRIAAGQPSPEFTNYLSSKGGTKNLSDYKGKYVYIDLWATWCKPCIAQFPALKKLHQSYKNKNIVFLSISVDDDITAKSWDKAKSLWRNALKQYKLTGEQLFATDKQFMTDYLVGTIPRFILLDPEGKIVSNNAPRPTDPQLVDLLDELGI